MPTATPPATDGFACLACGTRLHTIGTQEFRVGGPRPGQYFFRQWAELDETLVPLEVLFCPACRRVEMRVPAGYADAKSPSA